MTDSDSKAKSPALVILLTEPAVAIEPTWLETLRRQLPGEIVASEGGPAPDGLEVLPGSRGPWWTWLGGMDARRSGHGVVLLAPGLSLPERFSARLDHVLRSPDCPPLLTLPGNHQAGLDPAAGLMDPADERIDAIVQAAAELQWSPARFKPARLAIIPPRRIEAAIRQAEQGHCWIYDGLWIRDPRSDGERGPDTPDLRAALGHLQYTIGRMAGEGEEAPLPLFGFDSRPVVLHISHDWGGGVARWIGDLVAADTSHDHLVLSAGGRTDGKVHGQWLKLYAAGPGRTCIREWALTPAIAGTDIEHPQYREILDALIRRFGVARIVVSSLIGHSLDALTTGLPTLEMLHDYYPAWPVLDQDPLAWTDEAGRIDLDRAIAESGERFLFAERRGKAWRDLAGAWLGAISRHDVALAAPGEHVLGRWRRLVDDGLEQACVVPHGFSGWPADAPGTEPRALSDGRLNLVVVGRLSPGKGLGLLEAALDGLRKHARVTLLGCGHHGMRFFGRPEVDIVLDYRHEDLPRHLARIGAQAVLFLSTVAETWNYVLTETRALGLVPLATRTGSFAERIRDDVDGVLFEPEPQALIETVSGIAAAPERLAAMRADRPAEPSMSDALSSLYALAPASAAPVPPATASDRRSAAIGSLRSGLTEARIELRSAAEEGKRLADDLEERTRWARTYERLSQERTRWAHSLESELRETQETVAARDRQIQSLDKELRLAHAQSQQLGQDLQIIMGSRSWKLTRPLRLLSRLAANTRAHRAWHPGRWPALLGQFVRNWRMLGPRDALNRLHLPAAAVEAEAVAAEMETAQGETVFEREPVSVPAAERPRASIVIPVFNKVEYTANCLNSLVRHSPPGAYEVIVIDDCSSDETRNYLRRCRGIRVLRNRKNSGFIQSCNAGARAAQGEYLVLLNNDTSLSEGWLDALLDTFEQHPGTGVVGGRLVYPDGRLQEAGGIIFSDASGWNYGRNQNAALPQYNFVSEADYVSGACLAIARRDFEEIGGFDTRFAPAYYEDTDLCFAMRERGRKVVYQPAATIIHHEGVSSGTDESSGVKRYQAVNRDKFRQKWQAMLADHPSPEEVQPDRADPVRHIRFRRTPRHVLVIDAVTPQPDHDSGSVRIVAVMRQLREMGYQVSFMPQNLAWISRYSDELQQLGIEVLHAAAIHRLEEWLLENGRDIDVALVSRHYVLAPILKLIRKRCRNARILFDTVDLHYLREQREAEITGSEQLARDASATREQELQLIRQSDVTLVVSTVEKSLLEREVPGARIEIVSNVHDVHGRSTGWKDRRDLMFVGGFQHVPNIDAARWLVKDIFPRVRRELPDVRLHLIGSRMPEEMSRWDEPGVEVHGFVANLEPFLENCRLSLAPLRYGAGVKGKVNQAMSRGLPVVATSCAAEGMSLAHERDVLIADRADDLAAQIVRAYSDEVLWTRLSDGGLKNVEKHFSVQAAREALQRVLADAE